MKKTTKNTNKKSSVKSNASKNAYNLDEYRNRKSTGYKSELPSSSNQARKSQETRSTQTTYGMNKNNISKSKTKASNSNKKTAKDKRIQSYMTNYERPENNIGKKYTGYSKDNKYNNTSYSNDYTTRYRDPITAREDIRSKNKISRKEAEQLKRRKKARYRNQVCLIIIAVICGVYGSVKLVDMFRYPTVSYQTVREGMIDNSQTVQGLIVREEKVYTSNYEGDIHYLTGEGQKVKKQGEVCYVTKSNELQQLTSQIDQVDDSIYNIQGKREDLSEYQTEIYSLNKGIVNEIKVFNNNRSLEKTNDVYTLRKQIDRIVETRTDLYVNEPSDRTQSLQQERLALTKELENYQNVVKASESGIVSYMIDGKEKQLSANILKEIKHGEYEKILKESHFNNNNKSIGQVTKDASLYKLVVDDKWRIISYAKEEQAESLKEGEFYELVFSEVGNAKIKFQLEAKIQEEENVKLIFTTREQIVDFLPYRKVEFSIGENKAEGLKIPLSAIVEKNVLKLPSEYIIAKDKKQGVMKQSGELVEFIPISIQYKKDNEVYILQDLTSLNSVQVNDVIVNQETKDKFKISEVNPVKGVYTINGRYAKFKQIEIILNNKDSAIIKDDSQLKEFDQIISNPKSIKEDQLLKFMNIQNE